MKLHLPSALRGALLACFALACTTTVWAANDVTVSADGLTHTIDGSVDSSHFIKAETGSDYVLSVATPGGTNSLSTLNVTNISATSGTTKITINGAKVDAQTPNASFAINNLMVQDGMDVHLVIAAGTTVTLNNVNFTNKVTYEIEAGAQLIISADDCAHNSGHTVEIKGSGMLTIVGGTIDASESPSASMTAVSYQSGMGSGGFENDMKTWLAPYLAEGASISIGTVPGTSFNVNGPGTSGGKVTVDGYDFDWKASGGTTPLQVDTISVIIDPTVEIYRSGATGDKVWNLHTSGATGEVVVSVQHLKSGKLGDVSDVAYVPMAADDGVSFQGAVLSSSENVTIGGRITVTDLNMVKLRPAAGTTMEFLKGDGALSTPNGLELSGGAGSTVILHNVSVDTPHHIIFKTDDTTLAVDGMPTLNIWGDASRENKFLPTSNLVKLDGGTMNYMAATTDAIGSLSNEKGTLNIQGAAGGAFTLTANKLTAGTLNLTEKGTTVKVNNQTTAGTLNIGYGVDVTSNIVQADKLILAELTDWSSTGAKLTAQTMVNAKEELNLGMSAQLSAPTITSNGNITVGTVALLTGNSISATGTTTVAGKTSSPNPHGIIVGGMTLNGTDSKTEAKLTNMVFTTTSLSADSTTNANITVKGSAPTISLGAATNSVVDVDSAATIANTIFTGTNTVTSGGSLTLNGTTHDANTSITANNYVLATGTTMQDGYSLMTGGATLVQGGALVAGGTEYKVSDVPQRVTIGGTADQNALTITSLYADLTGMPTPTTTTQAILTSTSGTIAEGSGLFFDYLTDPGMVPYLVWSGAELGFDLKDESDKILNSLKTSPNAAAAIDTITDYGMGGGTGALFDIFNYLRDTSRADFAKRQAALNALVSGSITMMADSQRQGVLNNVNRLRNRIIQMGNPQGIELEKNIHAWISADGTSSDIDQDGACAGYEYQTWGGTVGVHADVGNFSFGAAISAAYGDLASHGSDNAEADHDTITLSAFARHQSGRWTQMGILSLGRNEIEMTRNINAAKNPGKGESLSYHGKGDASGHTITGYYEAGYTFTLTEEGTQVLQPMASIMLTSARMGDYTETGTIGNAGLCADTEDYFYGTVGIGARYQLVLGTTNHDRLSFLELRAKLVQDFGDETNERTTFFSAVPGQGFTVKGADVGRTGFQLGGGVSVPMGEYTTLFADVDADFRSGATSVGGSVGVRVEF